jgi:hypothetical protein
MILERKPGKGFNALTVLIGLSLLSFWIYFAARITAHPNLQAPHVVVLFGFGAIFTLFVVKVACAEPAAFLASFTGLIAGILAYVILGPPQYPLAKALFILGPAALVGVPLFLALRKTLPRRLALRGEELAVVYTIIIIGTATAFVTRSTFQAAQTLWRPEFRLEKWIPPHFLPAPGARDDVSATASASAPTALPAADATTYVEKGARKGLYEGRAKPPWWSWYLTGFGRNRPTADWTFPAIFWTILLLTVEFFFLFLALLFRKRWVEEERYPFPMAQMPLAFIGENEALGAPSYGITRARWIAFAAGVALCAVAVFSVAPTDAREVIPLRYLFFDSINPRINLTGYSFAPQYASIVWLEPFSLLILLFAPIDVLLTALVTFIGIQVVVFWGFQMLTQYAGLAPDINFLNRGLGFGGAAGLAFWTLLFQWPDIGRLFTAFAQRTRSVAESPLFNMRNALLLLWAAAMVWSIWVYPSLYGPSLTPATRWLLLIGTTLFILYLILSARREKVDPSDREPIGARSLFLLLSATGLSFVALTLPPSSAALLVGGAFVIFVYAFAGMRARGEMPLNNYEVYDQARVDAAIQGRYTPGPSDPSLGIAAPQNHWWNTPPGFVSHLYTWEFGSYYKRWAPHNSFLDTFKIGHETGATPKDILKALVLAMTVAAVVTPILTIHLSYVYGLGGVNLPMYYYEEYMSATGHAMTFGTTLNHPPNHFDDSPIFVWPVVAFFAMGVMVYMRREYVWFPFHPIGFLVGAWLWQPFAGVSDMWFTFFVAWLLKRSLFKWFGIRFFRDKVQPILVFIIMGMVLGIILYVLRYALQYNIGIRKWG